MLPLPKSLPLMLRWRHTHKAVPAFLVAFLLVSPTEIHAVDFRDEIEPILQANCHDCHGPDEANGQLRLDRLANMLRGGNSGEPAIIPGDPGGSFLIKLIKHEEAGLEMPPDDTLSANEIKLIETWIAEGAKTTESYGPATEAVELDHWSFRPLGRPSSADSIDGFVHARLASEGLEPSPPEDRRVLIRRLFLVMLGLPPTPEQVDAFVNDASTHAWQDLVDHVLASQRYGERWASHWLDLVRFAETNGFETNRERPTAWRYRDWVIESLNDDKPYDEFVRQQIAGDALNAAIGTGFLVAGPMDLVKSQDPKLTQMQRQNELDDIINTCGTAFLGLTTGCARCHNHKFDPITQKDYYAMQAVFAGVQHGEAALPLSDEAQQRIDTIQRETQQLRERLAKYIPACQNAVIAIDDANATQIETPQGTARYASTPSSTWGDGQYSRWKNEPGKPVATYQANVQGSYRVWLSWGAGFDSHSTDARYVLKTAIGRTEIAKINQQKLADGSGQSNGQPTWSGFYDAGVYEFNPEDLIVLESGDDGAATTADVIVLQDVSNDTEIQSPALRASVTAKHNVESFAPREAKFVRFVIEATNAGEPCIDELEIFSGDENVAMASLGAMATSAGDFQHPKHNLAQINDGQFGNSRSWIASARSGGWVQIELPKSTRIDRIEWARDRSGEFADRVATKYRIECASEPGQWHVIASSADRLPHDDPSRSAAYVFASFTEDEARQGQAWLSQLNEIEAEREQIEARPRAWIGSFSQPGATHRLYRGEPDAKREQVSPNAIDVFTSLDLDQNAPEQQRRVAFANWVTDEDNPLTARLIVNRLWQFQFGVGIVDTPSDFGLNGTPPSHPELLDWLACELIENDWSLKHIHRLILHSATWQQSSRPTPAGLKVDANTRLLWRFPTRRLEAEAIRDSVLAASGRLDLENAGGPGFSAFEVELENVRHYHAKQDYGPADWRRMIYMTKVRQEKDHVFGAFDCPDASMVMPKRSRSTTPLQALNLLNSRFVMQQAEILATRLKSEADTVPDQIIRAWQLCFQRSPTEQEIADSEQFIKQEGIVQFTRAVLNANEFVFIP